MKNKKKEDKCENCMCRICSYNHCCGYCPGCNKNNDCNIMENCIHFREEP